MERVLLLARYQTAGHSRAPLPWHTLPRLGSRRISSGWPMLGLLMAIPTSTVARTLRFSIIAGWHISLPIRSAASLTSEMPLIPLRKIANSSSPIRAMMSSERTQNSSLRAVTASNLSATFWPNLCSLAPLRREWPRKLGTRPLRAQTSSPVRRRRCAPPNPRRRESPSTG
jgi:hypothetical protein